MVFSLLKDIIVVGDNMKALVLGGSSVDTLIHVNEIKELKDDLGLWADNVVKTIGGSGAGKALALDAFGVDVTFLSDVGNDTNGQIILDYFHKTNIRLIPLETDKSTAHTNIMHSKGKRISITTSSYKNEPEYYNDIEKLLDETDVVFLNIYPYCKKYIPVIKKSNKPVFVDIHDYDPPNPYHQDFIEVADYLVASGVYIDNHDVFLEDMIKKGKKLVVITNGSDGLIALDFMNNQYILPGYNDFEYIDSNGAGDSFCAGLYTELFETDNIGESLKIGTICGAIACTSYDLYNKKYDINRIREIKKSVKF